MRDSRDAQSYRDMKLTLVIRELDYSSYKHAFRFYYCLTAFNLLLIWGWSL